MATNMIDTRTFAVTGETGQTILVVRNDCGSVAVRRGDEPYVQIKTILNGDWSGIEAPMTYHQDGSIVTVATNRILWPQALFWNWNAHQVDIEITLPRESTLH